MAGALAHGQHLLQPALPALLAALAQRCLDTRSAIREASQQVCLTAQATSVSCILGDPGGFPAAIILPLTQKRSLPHEGRWHMRAGTSPLTSTGDMTAGLASSGGNSRNNLQL